MAFKVTTAVATEPVTLVEAKLHLRVDTSDEDALITALITAARQFAEHYTGRALAPQTLEMALDAFPACNGDILLDMPPVATVTYIKYTDEDGTEQTLSASDYAFSLYGDARRISLAADAEWPATDAIADAVRVRYVTGYAATPKIVFAAILLLIGHLYENRQDVYVDMRVAIASVPNGAAALLDTVKLYGF